jgi:Type IV secretion-system coupling protein DNA-binding domain
VINPVVTKVHRYLGSAIARSVVGQPRSTVDFRDFVARGRIVVVNLNAFDVGEEVAALVGGTLLNLAARAVSAQATLPPAERRAVTLCVDEFHTIPGADYEQVFGELAKYGANMILATQTLARLDRLTASDRGRELRAVVFANLDGLFAFQTSAEDARYLARELGGGLDEQDVLELGHYQCYARLTDTRTGERLPAFSVLLDPPATGDSAWAERLARASAERYGRDAVDVDLALQAAAERIRRRRTTTQANDDVPKAAPPADGDGVTRPDQTVHGGELPVDAGAEAR